MASVAAGKVTRRRLIGTSAAAAAVVMTGSGVAGAAEPGKTAASRLPEHLNRLRKGRTVHPPKLRPGDKVRVVSPGSTPDRESMARGIEILQSWGLVVELGEHVYDEYGYLAGKDEDRLADLNAALADPEVRGVFAARGGYGCQRIADGIDLRAVRRDPKVLVGFSDITSLQAMLWESTRLATVHGPMVNWDDERTGPESIEALRAAVMSTDQVKLERDPEETTAPVLVPGKASGVVLGGNLSLVSSSVGARDQLDLRDAIFFVEEVGEANYRIDRMLTQLLRCGDLPKVAGVVIGQITDSSHDEGEWDAVGVLQDRLGALGVPVLGGLKLGHGPGQLTIPLGSMATMDADAGTLIVESAVSDG
ncbi:S66 peptidase family protein [Thermocrispum municipale]|jgi:muramoyltetrapeptide carboxypeptidase|uniref:S66 peptidase family protein n=1 Tax=Thermocrispum municipale TaxID=37926 RepID=UPI0003F83D99|nr:LD-carboxypeptidase [Thermocrispum municipale]